MREKKHFQVAVEVLDKKNSGDICQLTLKAPEISRVAKAGQFVMVRIGELTSDPLLRRPFSIHSVDNETVSLLFKVVGRGTKILSDVQIAEKIDIVGPLGNGFTVQRNSIHYLVGGGMGIAPLLFLADQIKRNDNSAQVVALIGARSSNELIVVDELKGVAGVEVCIATDDGSYGHNGLVTELLAAKKQEGAVYCCGPWPMMKAVAEICRNKKLACQVSLETMMGCGVGACLGCAVEGAHYLTEKKYLHVCKDGPVYEAERVWG